MTTEPTKPYYDRLHPRFFKALGRTVPATKQGRVRMCGGPIVSVETLAQHGAWLKTNPDMNQGQLIDKLTAHGVATKFHPF